MVRRRSARVMVEKPRPRLATAHFGEGHLGAVRRADAHVLQVAQRAALVLGVAHHHAHVVASALDALRVGAEEGLAHLAAQVCRVKPMASASGFVMSSLISGLPPRKESVMSITPGYSPRRVLTASETSWSSSRLRPESSMSIALPPPDQVGGEGQLYDVGDVRRYLTPAAGDLAGCDREVF